MFLKKSLSALLLAFSSLSAYADITVGINLSSSGPAAAIGITSKNAIQMWPDTIAGEKAHYIILDDASDTTTTVKNIRKFINEDKVDVIIGPNLTASALAVLEPIATAETPMVALAASAVIIQPSDDPHRRWAFKMPQNDSLMAQAVVEHMSSQQIKKVSFIGFSDSYGESWWNEFAPLAKQKGIEIVANERFQRTDTSVSGQVLKLLAAKPDAVFIAGSGTPAALPQKTLVERGFKGPIYQTHGIATPEFLKLGGKAVENTLLPTGPSVVALTLPESHPVRTTAVEFVQRYHEIYGPGSVPQFAGDAWGAWVLVDDAAKRALATGAKPGSVEFRRALRDALEQTNELVIPNGVMTMSPTNHQGFDGRARVMGQIKNGQFVFIQ